MSRTPRFLAALSTVAVLGTAVLACGADDSARDTAGGIVSDSPSTAPLETTSAVAVPGVHGEPVDIAADVATRWNELGGPASALGMPTGPSTEVEGGSQTPFERGMIVLTPDARPFVVQGEILSAYLEAGGPEGGLGFPTSDEATTDGGWISTFEGGSIAFLDGAVVVEEN